MTHFDESIIFDKSISDVQDQCDCILPNSPDIKAGPNNCSYVKRPCDHASKYHYLDIFLGDPSSSSPPVTLAVKRTSSEDPACSTFTKKAKNTIVNARGQALCSKFCTIVSDDKKVKVTVKGKV